MLSNLRSALFILVALLPSVAAAQDDRGGEGDKFELPFDVSADARLSMGFGKLNPSLRSVDRSDAVSLGLGLSVSREITDGLTGTLGSGWSTFLTAAGTDDLIFCDPDASGEPGLTDGECVRRYRGWIDDLSVRLSYAPIYVIPGAGIRISGSLASVVPLSRNSRISGLRTFISPGVSLSRGFGPLSLSYGFGFNKRWYRYTSVVLDARELDIVYRTGGAEDIAVNRVAEAGVNTSWSISNNASLGFAWTDDFSTSVSWAFSHAQGYNVFEERDEFTSDFATVGRVGRQSMTGTLSASYSFLDHYGVALAMSTSGAPKTADNRRVRFPFFDTESGNQSRTNVSLSLSASY